MFHRQGGSFFYGGVCSGLNGVSSGSPSSSFIIAKIVSIKMVHILSSPIDVRIIIASLLFMKFEVIMQM